MRYSSKGQARIKDSNNKSKILDKFYTQDHTVDIAISYLKEKCLEADIDLSEFIFLEPCAGKGAFLDGLERHLPTSQWEAYDIEPDDSRIVQKDFLTIPPRHSAKRISIGNPPFGYKGDLAIDFINRCADWGPIIAFVLPIQFRRYHTQKRVFPNLKLIFSSGNLPRDSFLLEDKAYHVNSLFQIWVDSLSPFFRQQKDLRLVKPLPNRHEDFILYIHNNTVDTLKYFDKDKYEWDFAVTRQGFYDYNERIHDPGQLKPHVQYLFVKYVDPISKTVFDQIDFEKLSHVNTAILGFSNTDLVAEYVRTKERLMK